MHPMNEHRAHKVQKSRVSRMTKGYASGGGVASNAGLSPDHSAPKAKSTMGAIAMEGKAPKARMDKRARGGRTKGKGHTTVNVITGHQGAPMAAPPMMPPPAMARPPMPPPAAPPGPMPAGMGGPGGPPGGPMMPPGGIRRQGGRTYASGGGVKSGAAWASGLKNGTQVQHAPGKQDIGDIARPRQKTATTYATGGAVESPKGGTPAKADKHTMLPGGSGGGEARLVKEARAKKSYRAASSISS